MRTRWKALGTLKRKLNAERRAVHRGGRRQSDHEVKRGWVPAFAIALAVALVDWTVKALVVASVPLGELRVVWQERLALWHVRNPAMILGLYGNFPLGWRKVIALVFGVVGVVLLLEIVGRGHRLPPRRRPWAWLFVGLVLGGMLGNLGERVVHWGVTDYLSFGWNGLWLPPGNVADLALFLSIPVAAVVIVFELAARSRRGAADSAARLGVGGDETAPSLGR